MAARQPPPSSASAPAPAAGLSMKDYLKRYVSGPGTDGDQKRAKKKTKKKPKPAGGVLIVDEDPVWQKPVQVDEEPASSGDDKPLVDEDIEVKRMRRLEAIRAARPYNAIAEDGSGWVTVAAPEEQGGGSTHQRRNDTPLPERGRAPTREDLSPVRRRQRRDTPSPVHGDAAAKDFSPPRRPSPVHGDAAAKDFSPPRRRQRRNTPSPVHGDAAAKDFSPPRRRQRRDTPSPVPDGAAAKDFSPPRRRQRRQDTPSPKDSGAADQDDMSPPRKSRQREDLSPPRKGARHITEEPRDISPRKKRDISPSRKSTKEGASKQVKKSGLMTAEEVKEDIRKIKEAEMIKFASQDPSLVGKGAKAVFRDKEGRRISEEEMCKAKEPEKPKEIHIEWGKGLVQKREAESRLKEIEAEKSKPFARTRDDPELDNMLKERIRWGDPMAHLVKRKDPEFILEDLGDDEKMKESGFIVPQSIPTHSWLKRGVDAPPNRYGIKPGRHWDGVDRGNGFEKDMFKLKNEKQAMEQEAYLWSVSDM
ncbi:uncharacterized LOC100280266 [Zea mays]|uniref:Uncharacterized protein n=1 Tax=Zea mays TaxID=4577 RepID=B8A2U4_MAIZE|nr:uncharacterized LOC100280266 [Zea mays]ACL54493.1 unknown [Zea mays]|eukprot:NP_001146666.1 uncharacterized protein LOC100280266 [Zea mays]